MSSIKSSYGHSERIAMTPCLAWLFLGWIFCGFTTSASAQDESTGNLAAAAQNPIANMISLPLQNNTFFGVTESDETANVLNIQPVYPISAGDWNVITRTIVPIIHIPDPTSGIGEIPNSQRRGSATGLGDINFSAFLSPAHTGRVIWGVGPSLSVPSATDDQIGSEKWSAGPTAVALMSPKPWLFGALVKNLWSFAGDFGPGQRQPAPRPALRELQSGRRLVSRLFADHHRELGGGQRQPLGGPGRRRRRQDLQYRQPADQRPGAELLLRRVAKARPRLGAAVPDPVSVSEVTRGTGGAPHLGSGSDESGLLRAKGAAKLVAKLQ
jgi:hypothetical protein